MRIEIRCAWCGRSLGMKEANEPGLSECSITHSICPTCRKRLLAEADEIQAQSTRIKKGENHD